MKQDFFEEANKLFHNFKDKAKIKDLKYLAQIAQSQDDESVIYAIQFTNVADNIAPATFLGKTSEEVVDKVNKFLETMNYDEVEIKYHEAQAFHANETAKRHLKIVEDIKKRLEEKK